MSEREQERARTQALVAALARDLVPVRLVPPLWVLVGVPLAVSAAAAALLLVAKGIRPDAGSAMERLPALAVIAAGLALLAPAALVAALARLVPGRERVAAGALRLGVAGLLVLVAGAPLALAARGALLGPAWAAGIPFAKDAACFAQGVALALPAIVAAAWAARRARGPTQAVEALVVGAAAAAGCIALTTLAVHLGCPGDGARHLLLGHVGAPLAGGVVAGLAIALATRARAQRV